MIARLINQAWCASMHRHERAFRAALQRPGEAQRVLLRSIITHNADTAFGRDHRFDQISCIDRFRKHVPIADDCAFEPYIERIAGGEPNVLTADRVTHLIPTSGSSGPRKLIPHTASLQRQFDAALGPWVRDLFRRFPGAARGRAYWSVSPAIPSDEQSAVTIGFQDDTAYLGPLARLLVRRLLAVPPTVRHIADTQRFWQATALHLLAAEDLSLISVWHPSYLDRLLDEIASHWEDLLGRLPRRRAAQLRRTRPDDARAIWPRLALVSVWADAAAALPFARARQRMPGVGFQAKGLLATECWTTIPYRDQHPLTITSHFFEFIDEQGRPHLCDELIQGQHYETAVTTAGGLYRYRTGDRVEVSGSLHASPTLRLLGRNDSTSDLTGEKLHESHVSEALQAVFAETGYRPHDQLLTPSDAQPPRRYVLWIAYPTPPPPGLAERIDRALCANPHYALARKLGQLDPPTLQWQAAPFRTLESAGPGKLGDTKPRLLATQAANHSNKQSNRNHAPNNNAPRHAGR